MDLRKYDDPCVEAILPFMQALEKTRQELTLEKWKHTLTTLKYLRKWRYFLCNDPYTRWAYIKPKGYQGDATVMDFAYRHKSISKEIDSSGDVGQGIYFHTSSSKQSNSARLRVELIAKQINDFSMSSPEYVSVASFASGHGRELELLNDRSKEAIGKFTAIDSDKSALAELLTSANGVSVITENKNVFRYGCDNPTYDFIYSLGLFDYLNDKQSKVLAAKMWQNLKSGGKMVIANLAHTAGNIGYCEAVMDWWMITRSKADMQSIADHLVDMSGIGTYEIEQLDCFNYLSIVKK